MPELVGPVALAPRLAPVAATAACMATDCDWADEFVYAAQPETDDYRRAQLAKDRARAAAERHALTAHQSWPQPLTQTGDRS